MRLIDADAIFNDCIFSDMTFERDLKRFIDSFETVDAVPVVRCKDCKYWENEHCLSWEYNHSDADDYCSLGERREDE